jgi:hypothetical protein
VIERTLRELGHGVDSIQVADDGPEPDIPAFGMNPICRTSPKK